MKRNPDIPKYEDDYENYKKKAKNFQNEIKKGKKTYQDFDKWLNTQDT